MKALNSPEFDRIEAFVAWYSATTPGAEALVGGRTRLTYGELNAAVQEVAGALRAAGLRPGERVAVLAVPSPEYAVLLLGILAAGGVYVGLNPRHAPKECAAVLQNSSPRIVFSMRSFESRHFEPLLKDAGCRVPVVLHDGLEDLRAAVRVLALLPAPLDAMAGLPPDIAVVVFTSGSTGEPKAAMLRHKGLILAARVQHDRLNPSPARYLSNLPVSHVGQIMNLTLAALVAGGALVFQERFDPADSLRLIEDEGVTAWVQVPMMFHLCVMHPAFSPRRLKTVQVVCAGGGPLSLATLSLLRTLDARLMAEYGQTETSSSGAYTPPDADDEVLLHTIGRFDARFNFRIADAQDMTCAMGKVGEIQARGALLMAGYLNDPAATKAALTADGWLRTGDLGTYRPDGLVVLKGRLREMIKSGGYNLYPREIELVLEEHPSVAQALVVGLPDEVFGEAAHALLVLRDLPVIDARSLKAWAVQRMANYKVPKSFRLLEQLPLLPNGKPDRGLVRQQFDSCPELL